MRVKKLDTSVNNNQLKRNCVVIGDNAGDKLVSYVDSSTRKRRWSDMDWTHSREKMEPYGLEVEKENIRH